ncbi:MAG: hypothetical protein WC100_19335 [Sterolibacterium sp.]
MTESMIERVKAAIKAELPEFTGVTPDYLDALYKNAAEAAIEAMREPTKTQLDAMEPWSRTTGHHELVWKAGIDAALTWPAGSADRAGVPPEKD